MLFNILDTSECELLIATSWLFFEADTYQEL